MLRPFTAISADERARCLGPAASEPGSLTEPRQFNLMFKTHCGALQDDDSMAYLRPETAQGEWSTLGVYETVCVGPKKCLSVQNFGETRGPGAWTGT